MIFEIAYDVLSVKVAVKYNSSKIKLYRKFGFHQFLKVSDI